MRVLIGCERSGVIRRAFRLRGHDAWSCDLEPSDDSSEFHHVGDALEFAKSQHWDLGIFHPPCTRLCNSGVLRLYRDGKKRNGIDPMKWAEMKSGRDFFMRCYSLKITRLAVENPIPHGHADLPHYSQKIQPWEFGHPESKATCLWLRNLPPLMATTILQMPECGHWNNQTMSGQNKLPPSPDRSAIRAKTYTGIADAMAEQWGFL